MRFQNKVVAVTGGASGIGLACCKRLASEGAKVAVIDINEEGAQQVANSLSGAKGYACDVTDVNAVEDVMKRIFNDFGSLDLAINNAGISGVLTAIHEYPVEIFDKVIATNLSSIFYCLRIQVPLMLQSGGGAIVNLASIMSTVAIAGGSPYVATKHGVVGMTKTAALEYGEHGIRVNCVGPTFTHTPLLTGAVPDEITQQLTAMHPMKRLTTVEEVAATVLFLLSDDASGTTGSYYTVDAGWTAQ